MRWLARLLLTIGLLACAGCSTHGSVNGGGTGNSGYGHAKIDLPF